MSQKHWIKYILKANCLLENIKTSYNYYYHVSCSCFLYNYFDTKKLTAKKQN